LDVVVIDQDGNEADFADGCSGGEQTRIGLALRIALARLLAHRRGAESRLLALDEPSYLDAAGMTALLDVLRGLEPEFDVILLVSHVAELRDALDQTVVVVKENDRSRIDGAPVPVEAVAA
jgi:exonuclease SbcC